MNLAPEYHPARRALDLGPEFYDAVAPAEFPAHVVRYRNQGWAARLGLGGLSEAEWIGAMAKFEPLPGSLSEPLAFRYHGHQFRSYNDELGDGRGFLYAQMIDPVDGRLLDLGTKGSGQTPYSRFGDGRLTLKGGVREILATAMLEALGVNTSKTFSLIETGESLHRNDEPSPTRSSVLVRLSHSHIRIGTFQRLSALGEDANIVKLLDYVVATYMPDLAALTGAARALGFLAEVQRRVARTGAQWMVSGFVHGVLNTDNINVTGESFDYGPWRFIPTMDPAFTAAYFDQTGLYAYGAQADAISWNLARLAECLLPLAPRDDLQAVLNRFPEIFRAAFQAELLRRLGLADPGDDAARDALSESLWRFLFESQAPFEQVLFDWYGGSLSAHRAAGSPLASEYRGAGFAAVRAAFADFAPRSADLLAPSYFSRAAPCTMLIDEVEAIWDGIDARDDWSRFAAKLAEIGEMAAAYGIAIPGADAAMGQAEV
jgi:serine/tyrosine/threonine adenylyltransferase